MIIYSTVKPVKTENHFDNVQNGEAFEYELEIYIKISGGLAFSLNSYKVSGFAPNTRIGKIYTKINMELSY